VDARFTMRPGDATSPGHRESGGSEGQTSHWPARVNVNVPRSRLGFYVYYPAHWAVVWIVAHLL